MRPCETVAKCPFTFTGLMSPCYIERRLSNNLIYTVDYTLVNVARNSSADACIRLHVLTVPNSEAEILNILKLP